MLIASDCLFVKVMRNFNIIPAIDVIEGRCVRLTQGDYAKEKVYSDNPVEMAKRFERAGATRLHLSLIHI